jgi:transposase-like protein
MEPTMEAGVEPAGEARAPLGPVVKIDEGRIREHLDEVVRSTVEETLNALLDAEADQLCGARKYERTEGRKDTRAGSYDRHLQTKAGEVTLTVPKLRNLPFETAIIERYRRRESSVEEALIEMYLAGVSVRRVEDITQALWGTRVSASTVSDLNQKIYGKIDAWRERPLVGDFPYVFLDGLWLKRSWGGEVKNVSVLVAIGVAQSGYREILAVSEGAKEDTASWTAFLRELKERGLKGVELFVSDKCLGLVENLADFYPDAKWQRCAVGPLKKPSEREEDNGLPVIDGWSVSCGFGRPALISPGASGLPHWLSCSFGSSCSPTRDASPGVGRGGS